MVVGYLGIAFLSRRPRSYGLVEIAVRTTISSGRPDRLRLHMAARRIAPLAALVAALLWMFGLYFSARPAESFLTRTGYLWLGVAAAAFGLLIVPVIVSTARDRTLQLAGLLIQPAWSSQAGCCP